MELYVIFLKGLLIAVIFGVPAGTIGALTVQRTIEKGFKYGFATGLGSTAADLLYASVSVFGISVVSDFLLKYQIVIRICGCILVFIYGIMILKRDGKNEKTMLEDGRRTSLSCFLSSFAVAILNPATILSFTIAFTSFGIPGGLSASHGCFLLMGIFVGTGSWWLGLSGAVTFFKNRITERIYHVLNICLGGLLILFSCAIFVSLCCSIFT